LLDSLLQEKSQTVAALHKLNCVTVTKESEGR